MIVMIHIAWAYGDEICADRTKIMAVSRRNIVCNNSGMKTFELISRVFEELSFNISRIFREIQP